MAKLAIEHIQINGEKIAKEILKLQKESYKIEAKLLNYYKLPPFSETIDDLINSDEEYLAYKINNKICGILSFEVIGDFIEISKLFVSPQHFKKGIASQLLKKLEELADNAELLMVKTGFKNKPARNFYQKHDFKLKRVSIVDGYLKIAEFEKHLIKIRKAEKADVVEIKTLLGLVWDHTYRNKIPQNIIDEVKSLWHSLEKLSKEVLSDKIIFNVAEENNQIVGILTASEKKETFYLNRLYVLPTKQRKGIGKKLLNNLIRSYNVKELELDVIENNEKAINFYLNEGFRQISKNSEKVIDFDLNTLVMTKEFKY
jgi:ribosomal protein S18 acetylase RimI-like enzyme